MSEPLHCSSDILCWTETRKWEHTGATGIIGGDEGELGEQLRGMMPTYARRTAGSVVGSAREPEREGWGAGVQKEGEREEPGERNTHTQEQERNDSEEKRGGKQEGEGENGRKRMKEVEARARRSRKQSR